MSDVFEGPGWWLASDGKWYAPHLHHDSAYRARFATPPPTPTQPIPDIDDAPVEVVGSPKTRTVPDEAPEAASEPPTTPAVVEAPQPDPVVAVPAPRVEPAEPESRAPQPGSVAEMLSGIDAVVEPAEPTSTPVSQILDRVDRIREREPDAQEAPETPGAEPAAAPQAPAPQPTPTVTPPTIPDTEPEPEPRVVVDTHVAPPTPDPSLAPTRPTRARLELGTLAEPDRITPRFSPSPEPEASERPSLGVHEPSMVGTTEIVHVGPLDDDYPDMMDRLVAAALFVSGVAMIVGTFMVWERVGETGQSGWELGQGIATVIAGVVGSAAAGPVFVGYRHMVPRAMAIVCGLVALVVVSITGVRVVSDAESAATTVGGGFWIVLIGAAAMLITGVGDRNRILR